MPIALLSTFHLVCLHLTATFHISAAKSFSLFSSLTLIIMQPLIPLAHPLVADSSSYCQGHLTNFLELMLMCEEFSSKCLAHHPYHAVYCMHNSTGGPSSFVSTS